LYNTRLQEQDNLAVAQGNVALNLISVYRALGGGWQIRCQDDRCCKVRTTDFTPDEAPPSSPSAVGRTSSLRTTDFTPDEAPPSSPSAVGPTSSVRTTDVTPDEAPPSSSGSAGGPTSSVRITDVTPDEAPAAAEPEQVPQLEAAPQPR